MFKLVNATYVLVLFKTLLFLSFLSPLPLNRVRGRKYLSQRQVCILLFYNSYFETPIFYTINFSILIEIQIEFGVEDHTIRQQQVQQLGNPDNNQR